MPFNQFNRISKKTPPPSETPASEKPKPVVVIIDDDQDVLRGLQLILQQKYTVRVCSSWEEGRQAVDEDAQVVILDIKMPGKNGLEVYGEIKALFPDLPIIFYSAYQDMLEAAKLSMRYKPFKFFDKSEKIDDLLKSIQSAVQYYINIQKLRGTSA